MKIKTTPAKSRRGAVLLALALASCSQGPTSPTAGPGKPEKSLAANAVDGSVQGSAAGDVKNGPIEIDLVRVAQTDGVPAFYANPGGEYVVRPNLEVEIYIQIWTSNPAVATPPRLIVDWGVGETDNIHCGPCRLSRTYRTDGKYRVTVTMDDRAGGVTRRTFTLEVGSPQAAPGGVTTFNGTGLGTFNGTFTVSDPQFNRGEGSFVPPSPSNCTVAGTSHYYHTYSINHPGGPLSIETTAASLSPSVSDDTFLHLYAGSVNPGNACENIVASDDDSGGGTWLSLIQATFPAGQYVLVVTTYDGLDIGTYTLVIQ